MSTLDAFPHFQELGEDICLHILSFVADAPLEERLPRRHAPLYRSATLTCYLPLVCKRFYEYAQREIMWEPALRRQILAKECWRKGFKRIVLLRGNDEDDANYEDDVKEIYDNLTSNVNLRKIIYKKLGESVTCKEVYKKILVNHIRYSGPMFIMPCAVTLGEPYGLHLFEPRYRIMVRELLEKYCANPEEARNGGPIRSTINADGVAQPPYLIHACRNTPHLTPGMMACLVEIVRTRVYNDGTADVYLMPISWVYLDRIWTRPSAGHLFCAKSTRS